ncbi:MAG: hypothetical protein ATN34_03830 [Epulopiscium sp. Nele67-Bin002]|nr:MAG: hypothetical protein ATN33_02440 [Epulopiscium sp. Nele67-Bin001]OON92604.1 MAG: hypothetical protein ATN34_03830 [Epulopiscium sp. Nele67-Bin002]
MNDNKQFFKLYWHQLRLVFMAIVGMKICYHLWGIISVHIGFIGFGESVIYLGTPYTSALLCGISALIGLISSTRIFDSFLKIKANRKAIFFGTIVGGISLIGAIGIVWIASEWLELIILDWTVENLGFHRVLFLTLPMPKDRGF